MDDILREWEARDGVWRATDGSWKCADQGKASNDVAGSGDIPGA